MTAVELDHARRLLQDGDVVALPLLLRTVLESSIRRILTVRHPGMEGANGRSRLLALTLVTDEHTARRAGYLWSELSTWCHHHVYELAPHPEEMRHYLDETAWVTARLAQARPDAPRGTRT